MASIFITRGVNEGKYFRLPDEPIVSIGRDDQCTIQLLDPTISRKHLQIRLDDRTGRPLAADYRSANGVKVNGKLIADATPIKDGDQITIGETALVYLADDHPDAESARDAVRRKTEWKRTTLAGDE